MSLLKPALVLIGLLVAVLAIQRLIDPQAARRQRAVGMLVLLMVIGAVLIMWHGITINVP